MSTTKVASPTLHRQAPGPARRCSSRAGGDAAEQSPAVRPAGAGFFTIRKDPAMALSPSHLAPLLTIPATAKMLGVSVCTIRRLRSPRDDSHS